jgi:putative transcriptional regulator
MAKKTTEDRRVQSELLGMLAELNAYGLVSKPDLARIKALYEEPPAYTPERVVRIRTRIAKTSQAAFASLLNVSVSTVQKWESPTADKRPSGAAAKLLQLVEKKGIEAILA